MQPLRGLTVDFPLSIIFPLFVFDLGAEFYSNDQAFVGRSQVQNILTCFII